MTPEWAEVRRLAAVRARGHSIKDLTRRLKTRGRCEPDEDENEEEKASDVADYDPVFCSDACKLVFDQKIKKRVFAENESSMYLATSGGSTDTDDHPIHMPFKLLR